MPVIDSALCKGGDACVKVCPHHAIPYQAIYWFEADETGIIPTIKRIRK